MISATDKINVAESVNATMGGRVWCPDAEKDSSPVRIYCRKGYIVIEDDGHANIDSVGGHEFDGAKAACAAAGVEARRW